MAASVPAKLILQIGTFICIAQHSATGQSCYSTNRAPYSRFSTKTFYEDVRPSLTVRQETVPGCEPSLLYGLIRHATRFPSSSASEDMREILPALQRKISQHSVNATICQEDLTRIQSWTFRVGMGEESQMAPVGYKEMKAIASRFRERYPGLLRREYNQWDFDIRHTHSERTKDSAKGFVRTLFNTTENIRMTFAEENHDRLLRFYDVCLRYLKEIDHVDVEEQEKFYKTNTYSDMARRVTTRLGVPKNGLTLDEIHVMHEMCAFDNDLYKDAPWCAAFSEDDLKILEYGEDVQYYYENGYGAPEFVQDQTCELMKDVVKHLRNGKQSSGYHAKVALRFGHSDTLLPFLAKLRLFKDDVKLRADNMATQANRKWQTSTIVPFSANFAFVVHRCGDTAKVATYLNENPFTLPGCSDAVCDFETALWKLETFADTCNFDEVCDNNHYMSHSVKFVPSWLYIFILFIAAAFEII